jgi:hypothetical protein
VTITSPAPAPAPASRRAPVADSGIRPVRRRQPLLAALFAVLFLLCIGLNLYLAQRDNREVEVVQVTSAIAVGEQIPASAIAPVQVAANSGIGYVLWSQRGQLAGYVATVALVSGQPVLAADVTTGSATPSGDEVVGLTVPAGDYPSGLVQGDKVTVRTVASSSGAGSANALSASPVLFSGATVAAVTYPPGSDPTSATALVNLDLSAAEATALAEGKASGALMLSIDGA